MNTSQLIKFVELLTVSIIVTLSANAQNTLPVAVDGVITLTEDVALDKTWNVTSNVILDLNGHELKLSYGDGSVIIVDNNANLTIQDSNPTVVHYFSANEENKITT